MKRGLKRANDLTGVEKAAVEESAPMKRGLKHISKLTSDADAAG